MLLRKFYPLELYVIENIVKQRLVMSVPKRFNDPFDCALLRDDLFLSNLKEQEKELLNRIRILCLFVVDRAAIEYDETQRYFWSFYGDSHKGFCIEINIPDSEFRITEDDSGNIIKIVNEQVPFDLLAEKIFSGNVEYHTNIINNIDTLKRTINRTKAVEILIKGLFYKDIVFKRENEFRIIKYTDFLDNDFDSFSIKKYPKKLILGRECPSEYELLMKNSIAVNYDLYRVDNNMREIKI